MNQGGAHRPNVPEDFTLSIWLLGRKELFGACRQNLTHDAVNSPKKMHWLILVRFLRDCKNSDKSEIPSLNQCFQSTYMSTVWEVFAECSWNPVF